MASSSDFIRIFNAPLVGALQGEVRYINRAADSGDWILLDGRLKSSLSAAQQIVANLLGYGTNIPDLRGRFALGSSGTFALNTIGGSTTIAQNQLPNVALSVNAGFNSRASVNVNNTPRDATPMGSFNDGSGLQSVSVAGGTSSINGGVVQQNYLPPYAVAGNWFVWLGAANNTITFAQQFPAQTGNANRVLSTDGNNLFWLDSGTTTWRRTGNTGTNPTIDFIGTIDAQPLVVRVQNTEAAQFTATSFTILKDTLTFNNAAASAKTISAITANAGIIGNNITIAAGNSGSGTNIAGGNLFLTSGASTGNAISSTTLRGPAAGASGTAANAVADYITFSRTATNVAQINAPNHALTLTAQTNSGVNVQSSGTGNVQLLASGSGVANIATSGTGAINIGNANKLTSYFGRQLLGNATYASSTTVTLATLQPSNVLNSATSFVLTLPTTGLNTAERIEIINISAVGHTISAGWTYSIRPGEALVLYATSATTWRILSCNRGFTSIAQNLNPATAPGTTFTQTGFIAFTTPPTIGPLVFNTFFKFSLEQVNNNSVAYVVEVYDSANTAAVATQSIRPYTTMNATFKCSNYQVMTSFGGLNALQPNTAYTLRISGISDNNNWGTNSFLQYGLNYL